MRQFLKQTTASFIGTIAGLAFFFGLGAAGLLSLLVLVSSTRSSTIEIDRDSVLVFDLAAPISDKRAPAGFEEIFSGNDDEPTPLTLRQTIEAVDAAAKDKRISGLFIDGSNGNSTAGLATLQEVREALMRFRESGKPILAYDVDGGERDFYLASVADTVVFNPLGGLEFNGFSARQAFFAGALEKYGIGVQVVRAGRFKSAVEPFVRQDLSPENREQLQALLGDLWQETVSAIAARRGTSATELQAIADEQGVLLPEAAKAAGLVDAVEHYDGILARLREMTGTDADATSFPRMSLRRYAEAADVLDSNSDSDRTVAVVYAEGNIVGGSGSQAIGGDRYAKIIRRLRQDETIKAIVLRVNSPGGSATASDVLLREILLAKETKPIVVSMGDVAASGGYWIATGANSIFATPSTITGSIGVFGLLTDIQQLANDNGITWDGVKTAELADLGTLSRPKTEAELARYQASVDRIYELFLEKVAAARSLSKERVAELAQGRVWSGSDALEVGLVDRIGGLDEAIAHAAEIADLGNDWKVREYPRLQNFEERLRQRLTGEEDASLALAPGEVRQIWQTWKVLQESGRSREVQARMPFTLVID